MQLTFLGTSAMVPTKERNHSAIFLKYNAHGFLFDCGEGTQRQMKIAEIKPSSITKIFISHWHGDHVLGIPGLLQTLAASEYAEILEIYGPKGTREAIYGLLKILPVNSNLRISVHDISKTKFLDTNEFYIEAYELEHNVTCLGYRLAEKDRLRINIHKAKEIGIPEGPLLGRLQRGQSISFKGKHITPEEVTYVVKGRIFGYIADTRLCKNCINIAENADLLVCEATYSDKQEEKASEYRHMTTKQAAFVAHQANVKKLVLTHFSQRYKDVNEVKEETRDIFPNTFAAHDFMKIKI
ncbi:MAG: ribonuclease Z [Candidatus Woesearchaeota archaeon]